MKEVKPMELSIQLIYEFHEDRQALMRGAEWAAATATMSTLGMSISEGEARGFRFDWCLVSSFLAGAAYILEIQHNET